jgi:transposase
MSRAIAELRVAVEALLAENQLLRNGHKSKTSHTPPSQDISWSNQKSLREKSGKPMGGQKGYVGNTLEMVAEPDEIIDHVPQYCQSCGNGLEEVAGFEVGRRQEVVIPPIEAKYVEHRCWEKVCPRCAASCTGDFPSHVTMPVQYGANVAAAVCYLSVSHYIPYRRISAMMRDLFNIPLSEGRVNNLLGQMAKKAMPFYHAI